MRLSHEQLRDKALLALEDAVQECRYRKPRRSFAVRFSLAYLYATSKVDREAFDAFWRDYLAPVSPWNFGSADTSLLRIYVVLGLERPDDIDDKMWKRWSKQVGHGGGNHDR